LVFFTLKKITTKKKAASLQTDKIVPKDPKSLPPLLVRLTERPLKERLHWMGVSYGLTQPLFRFWKRKGYVPVYLRQTANELTGEHSCIMIKQVGLEGQGPSLEMIQVENSSWVQEFARDFRKRFLELCGYSFKSFGPVLVLSILEATKKSGVVEEGRGSIGKKRFLFSLFFFFIHSLCVKQKIIILIDIIFCFFM